MATWEGDIPVSDDRDATEANQQMAVIVVREIGANGVLVVALLGDLVGLRQSHKDLRQHHGLLRVGICFRVLLESKTFKFSSK